MTSASSLAMSDLVAMLPTLPTAAPTTPPRAAPARSEGGKMIARAAPATAPHSEPVAGVVVGQLADLDLALGVGIHDEHALDVDRLLRLGVAQRVVGGRGGIRVREARHEQCLRSPRRRRRPRRRRCRPRRRARQPRRRPSREWFRCSRSSASVPPRVGRPGSGRRVDVRSAISSRGYAGISRGCRVRRRCAGGWERRPRGPESPSPGARGARWPGSAASTAALAVPASGGPSRP